MKVPMVPDRDFKFLGFEEDPEALQVTDLEAVQKSSSSTLILKVWHQSLESDSHVKLVLSFPAAARLARLLDETVQRYLYEEDMR